jgi:hypothetical protein
MGWDIYVTNEKRPIDRMRESAMSMTVGTPEDGVIKGFLTIGGKKMYIIKERSVYLVRLADDIDPGRTNPNIQATHQKISSEGDESDFVGRILLTARELFEGKFLEGIDHERALEQCVQIFQDVSEMREEVTSIRAAMEATETEIRSIKGQALPAILNAPARARAFLEKADHASQSLYTLCAQTYRLRGQNAKRLFDGFFDHIAALYGADDDFVAFMRGAVPYLRFLRLARNAVVHPKPNERALVYDYRLLASGELTPPTIEIIHPKQPEPEIALHSFMEQMTDQFITVTELIMAWICAKYTKASGNVGIGVGLIPEDQRQNKNVRYGYVMEFNGKIQRVG